jgi:hypothetical protein
LVLVFAEWTLFTNVAMLAALAVFDLAVFVGGDTLQPALWRLAVLAVLAVFLYI